MRSLFTVFVLLALAVTVGLTKRSNANEVPQCKLAAIQAAKLENAHLANDAVECHETRDDQQLIKACTIRTVDQPDLVYNVVLNQECTVVIHVQADKIPEELPSHFECSQW